MCVDELVSPAPLPYVNLNEEEGWEEQGGWGDACVGRSAGEGLEIAKECVCV